MKSRLKLVNFSGYLPDIIKQDIYLCALIHNVITCHINDVTPIKNKESASVGKYEMKPNKNFCIVVFKVYIIKIIFEKKKRK